MSFCRLAADLRHGASRRSLAIGLLLCVALTSSGCVYNQFSVRPTPAEEEVQFVRELEPPLPYRIRPGDRLQVLMYYQSDLNNEMPVRPDGRISLPLLDDILVAGRTPAEIDVELTSLYRQHFDKVDVTVVVSEYVTPSFYVDGAVGTPAALPLRDRMTVPQAIAAAGGALSTADLRSVMLIRPLSQETIRAAAIDLNDLEQWSHIQLRADDLLYVPQSPIGKANLWVRQYLSNMMPDFMRFSFLYSLSTVDERTLVVERP